MARNKSKTGVGNSRLVYSTDQPVAAGKGKPPRATSRRGPVAPADGVVRVWRQTAGRKGKGVTAITGLGLDAAELSSLAGALKKLCGSGGTAKAGVIEIQGDHRDKLIDELRKRGFTVKKAGG